MSREDDRMGARPLSAFQTASIILASSTSEDDGEGEAATIGIRPRRRSATPPPLVEDTAEGSSAADALACSSSNNPTTARPLSPPNAVRVQDDDDDVLRLLMHDQHADPPVTTTSATKKKKKTTSFGEPHAVIASASSEEYHSPHEEDTSGEEPPDGKLSPNPLYAAASSPYDYDVNWDMVGQLRRPPLFEKEVASPREEDFHTPAAAAALPTTSCSSLAEAAAASMLAGAEEDRRSLKFTPRRGSTGNPYNYQKYSHHEEEEQEFADDEGGVETPAVPEYQDVPLDENDQDPADRIPNVHYADSSSFVPTETPPLERENESTHTASNSSTSSGSSRRRRQAAARRRRRMPRASSASSSSPSVRSRRSLSAGGRPVAPSADDSTASSSGTGLRASLDSGMAVLSRWIRARSQATRSSQAARRAQQQDFSLGQEDLFALDNAGEDPRRMGGRRRRAMGGGAAAADDFFSHSYRAARSMYPPSILEEEGEPTAFLGNPRQRALSEPDRIRVHSSFFSPPSSRSQHGFRRRRSSSREPDSGATEGEPSSPGGSASAAAAATTTPSSVPTQLSSAALTSSLFHSPQRNSDFAQDNIVSISERGEDISSIAETSIQQGAPEEAAPANDEEEDPNRDARTRWIRINRRFQLIITFVALIFSLLLFAILVCWVVLTSAYVVSIDKACDVPLKPYYWLATLQLILDVFRTDIMRCIFRWDTNSNERIPARVITYNITYLIYAMIVLRLGIKSIFLADDETCSRTAPELYQSSAVFVILSISAWSTIVLGYLVPFCFVATLLTLNGYTPAADANREQVEGTGFQFPAAYTNLGAPAGCIDQLRTLTLEDFGEDVPHECCICMSDFLAEETIVVTECQHVFHKRCCQEWLRQARTCPVCRTDIPSSLPNGGGSDEVSEAPTANPLQRALRRDDFHQEVVNIIQILRRQEERFRERNVTGDAEVEDTAASTATEEVPRAETEMVSMEEGRTSSSFRSNS